MLSESLSRMGNAVSSARRCRLPRTSATFSSHVGPDFRLQRLTSILNRLSATSSHGLSRVHPPLGHSYSTVPQTSGIDKLPSPKQSRPIEKVLIANRGEIACRVIKTARSLGLKTVAVYSEADRNALHVRSADEAVYIGPASAQLSYLSTARILDAAHRTGANAIHPGYGFLSENAEFAEACVGSGITFIGPSAAAISLMGDKSASKKLMSAANVPVVPGYHGDDQNHELLQSEASRIGYPILIKPVLGGGGKGMRVVHREDEFLDNLTSALRESRASFGDSRVLIEKYIAQPRHIEVQVFGDKYGNVVHLFERDCSVQRRHQKIIEEAPAPLMAEDFRKAIGQAAVNAAKAVNYENAGTVEFIVDTTTGEFFFMEMNTRLQVEHPVTEMVTRQDLVEWQIRVANGEKLPLQQNQISLSGHAFEARIYAENVRRGFLPAAGVLHHYNPPIPSSTVRVETGVEERDCVSFHYDPMIAKLVVWGNDRDMALTKLRNCLSVFQVGGVPTNISFLKNLARHPAFRKGDVETHFIERFRQDLIPSFEKSSLQTTLENVKLFAALAAVGICSRERYIVSQQSAGSKSPWHSPSGFRLNHAYTRKLSLDWENDCDVYPETINLEATYCRDGGFDIKLLGDNPSTMKFMTKEIGNAGRDITVNIDGVSSSVSFGYYLQGSAYHIHVWKGDAQHHFSIPLQEVSTMVASEGHHEAQQSRNAARIPGAVTAPMAGLVVKVFGENGKTVSCGDPLLVLVAMKMEHVVKAPVSGVVTMTNAVIGQQVSDGAVLFHIKVEA